MDNFQPALQRHSLKQQLQQYNGEKRLKIGGLLTRLVLSKDDVDEIILLLNRHSNTITSLDIDAHFNDGACTLHLFQYLSTRDRITSLKFLWCRGEGITLDTLIRTGLPPFLERLSFGNPNDTPPSEYARFMAILPPSLTYLELWGRRDILEALTFGLSRNPQLTLDVPLCDAYMDDDYDSEWDNEFNGPESPGLDKYYTRLSLAVLSGCD